MLPRTKEKTLKHQLLQEIVIGLDQMRVEC